MNENQTQEDQIVDIGNEFDYVVNGLTIGFHKNVLNLDDTNDIKKLLNIIASIKSMNYDERLYGNHTTFELIKDSEGDLIVLEGDLDVYLKYLPEQISKKIKDSLNEYEKNKTGN